MAVLITMHLPSNPIAWKRENLRYQQFKNRLRSEVPVTETTKVRSTVFWNVTPCSLNLFCPGDGGGALFVSSVDIRLHGVTSLTTVILSCRNSLQVECRLSF
jgi:hypothetical protein